MTMHTPLVLAPVLVLALAAPAAAQNTIYSLTGNAPGDLLGYRMAGIGDIDFDGHPDIAGGSQGADPANKIDAGQVYVWSGRSGRLLETFDGDAAGDAFGVMVAAGGDLDGDTIGDILVGAHMGDTTNGTDTGYARAISGLTGKVLYTIPGDATGDRFAFCLDGVGDVDKDGHADFIVGSDKADTVNGVDSGLARVYSGKTGKVLFTFLGAKAGDGFGLRVAGLGDVNNDGFPDMVVGAPNNDFNGNSCGSATVFSGKDGAVLYTFYGDSANESSGQAVGAAGDVNMDGFRDILVGAYFDDNNGANSGSLKCYSGKDGKVLHFILGDNANDRFGVAVRGVGDVDGDGYDDFIGGAYLDDNNGIDSGSVKLFSGKDASVLGVFDGDAPGDRMGIGAAPLGDVDLDGVPDFAAGVYLSDVGGTDAGMVRVISGRALLMQSDRHLISAASGGTQTLTIAGGQTHAGRQYWVFGSVTGTRPGVTLGGVRIPLVPDAWTTLTIALANSPALQNTRGALDQSGGATAQLVVPQLPASAVGVELFHAVLVYDAGGYYAASSANGLVIVP